MEFEYDTSLTRDDALHTLQTLWQPQPESDIVLLAQAFGRVSACDLYAVCSFPVVRAACCDGIAVHADAFAAGIPDAEHWVLGKDYVPADTGDDFSDEFDAVIAIEKIEELKDGGIRFIDEDLDVTPGSGIRGRGSSVAKDELLVRAHTRLTPELVAMLAAGGLTQIETIRPPRVAFIPCGNELIPWGSFPRRGQNIESNSLLVSGILHEWGAEALVYPVVSDKRCELEEVLDRALDAADIVIVNAGSSRGKEDFCASLLQLRGDYFSHGVRAVPGRPVATALIAGKPVVNIPGPTAAAWLAMDWLVKGLVFYYFGMPAPERPHVFPRLAKDEHKPKLFERISRVSLQQEEDGLLTCRTFERSIKTPIQMRDSDGLLILPIGIEELPAGSIVDVELLRPLSEILARQLC